MLIRKLIGGGGCELKVNILLKDYGRFGLKGKYKKNKFV